MGGKFPSGKSLDFPGKLDDVEVRDSQCRSFAVPREKISFLTWRTFVSTSSLPDDLVGFESGPTSSFTRFITSQVTFSTHPVQIVVPKFVSHRSPSVMPALSYSCSYSLLIISSLINNFGVIKLLFLGHWSAQRPFHYRFWACHVIYLAALHMPRRTWHFYRQTTFSALAGLGLGLLQGGGSYAKPCPAELTVKYVTRTVGTY